MPVISIINKLDGTMHLYINKMQSAMRRVGDPDGFSRDPDPNSEKNPDPTLKFKKTVPT